ncbi:MAG: OmpA family protein [Gammaproteobacteria bacterium]|jgi:chemotaxis protein MotB|nr:OmpA family protein [Gammaproteobacteria bacterium]MBT4607284.1 OmpA family protein [Thiotrichales bacterium]MBT3473871.1 OmpA family protein [Gammaproteobacteria bacterium]MBT3892555.1 OmpA family protein [Gammaproteobacteria bacterium]MBT3966179.1 OmpA family protein [Gammaproteobacteria bacterium]
MADAPEKKCPAGLPAWLATFGDLMSLLLCFFVLLLSFATIDAKKMKKVVAGMDKAFGVQNEVIAHNTPMGTSIIALKWSPNVTKKTTKDVVRQETTSVISKKILSQKSGSDGESDNDEKAKQTQEDTKKIKKSLKLESFLRQVEVHGSENIIFIRLKDKAAFQTGKARLNRAIFGTLKKVAKNLAKMEGRIQVIGHTDDIPISNDEFSSNWELSSIRATAVLHKLMEYEPDLADRIQAEGHADVDPIEDNQNSMGRSANRRVEIILKK